MNLIESFALTFFYFFVVFIGFLVNKKTKIVSKEGNSKLQVYLLYILLIFLGVRLGSNEEVVNGFATIGINGVVIAVFILVFVAVGIRLVQKLFVKEDE